MSDEKTQWYYEQLRKNGMAVHKPSAQLAAGLKKVGDEMLQDWLKKAGPDGQAVVDAYRRM
jgi:TRAP-type C4-dicarboxylate transport system substrate-binding protein